MEVVLEVQCQPPLEVFLRDCCHHFFPGVPFELRSCLTHVELYQVGDHPELPGLLLWAAEDGYPMSSVQGLRRSQWPQGALLNVLLHDGFEMWDVGLWRIC